MSYVQALSKGRDNRLLGQLSPLKSMAGFIVYGLAGRLLA